ncbi:hypothetical protein [Spiroplasma platyhelix]|uniref:Uncharacterized protein n=1 Tax=Spiroplasma platyhelix PALS-1 TaxID=1276218 RepID=A0A846U917_9MOLU|nr:hypothetical protein [Spiroplasma platyhelix]MBE4704001.1 hypothetical protein [Spiroplasma platyhelix PALS-1]NKE38373.1 hypothetical protein [Spiroplasma platyhelix PALS-1]UJB29259.1 hypothetical protein SPLAT_v1c04950 [Spiroplasma platyhelix PALS-1]
MKSLLVSLATITLGLTSAIPLMTINVSQNSNSIIKESNELTMYLKNYDKDSVRSFYEPERPNASFHYLDITKRITNTNIKNANISLNKINFDNRQTEIHTKYFDSLSKDSVVFESSTLADPSYWDDKAFYEHTTNLYSDTLWEGVTRYTGELAVGLTKNPNTGKIFFVWGVYGHVTLGSNQAVVSAVAKSVVIKY